MAMGTAALEAIVSNALGGSVAALAASAATGVGAYHASKAVNETFFSTPRTTLQNDRQRAYAAARQLAEQAPTVLAPTAQERQEILRQLEPPTFIDRLPRQP